MVFEVQQTGRVHKVTYGAQACLPAGSITSEIHAGLAELVYSRPGGLRSIVLHMVTLEVWLPTAYFKIVALPVPHETMSHVTPRRILSLLLLSTILTATACSFLAGNPPLKTNRRGTIITDEQSTTVPVEEAPPTPVPNSRIEIIWSIPDQPVDGFVLHYGTEPGQLTSEMKLSIADLEKYQDPERGAVYRYILSNVSPNKPVYVALSSYIGETNSSMSEVQEIRP